MVTGDSRSFPSKTLGHGIVSWGFCRGQILALNCQGNVSVSVWWGNRCLHLPWTKGSGEGEQERLQPYKEGSDWAERNSLRWLWPDGLKLGAEAWDSKSWELGQGSECCHQLEQGMAGMVFLWCARGFTFSEIFHWHQHSGRNPSIHMLPAQRVLRCWSHCSEIPPSGEHMGNSQWASVYLVSGGPRKNTFRPLL